MYKIIEISKYVRERPPLVDGSAQLHIKLFLSKFGIWLVRKSHKAKTIGEVSVFAMECLHFPYCTGGRPALQPSAQAKKRPIMGAGWTERNKRETDR